MLTLIELHNRWEAAKAAGEDHVQLTRYEMRDVYSWQISDTSINEKRSKDTTIHYEGIPIEVVDA